MRAGRIVQFSREWRSDPAPVCAIILQIATLRAACRCIDAWRIGLNKRAFTCRAGLGRRMLIRGSYLVQAPWRVKPTKSTDRDDSDEGVEIAQEVSVPAEGRGPGLRPLARHMLFGEAAGKARGRSRQTHTFDAGKRLKQ